MTRLASLAAVGLFLGLAACAVAPLPPPEARLADIQAVRASGVPPLQVGAFTPGPGFTAAQDQRLTVRAMVFQAPGGSYSKYLGETLAAHLRAAGRLDPAAPAVVSGQIVDSSVDTGSKTPSATLAARFIVTRDGKVVFDKTLRATSTWDYAFMGVEAIPEAENRYMALYHQLANDLVGDPDFRKAVGAP